MSPHEEMDHMKSVLHIWLIQIIIDLYHSDDMRPL